MGKIGCNLGKTLAIEFLQVTLLPRLLAEGFIRVSVFLELTFIQLVCEPLLSSITSLDLRAVENP